MKNKKNVLYCLIIMMAGVINFAVQGQQKNGAQDTGLVQKVVMPKVGYFPAMIKSYQPIKSQP